MTPSPALICCGCGQSLRLDEIATHRSCMGVPELPEIEAAAYERALDAEDARA